MDLKALQMQALRDKKASQASQQAQANGTKPRMCTNPLAQLAMNVPTLALSEYWKTCLREAANKEKKMEEQKNGPTFQEADWVELKQHIHKAYHPSEAAADSSQQKNAKIDKIIKRLCTKDSQQLLLFLESQVQEYVIESKVGLLELLNKTTPGIQLSRTFLSSLIESYARLCSGARKLSPSLKGVEEKHLSMFGMSWEDLNKLLFERCVHADPVMQLKVPQFIGHLHTTLSPKDKTSCVGIFQRILALEDDMTVIAAKWKKVESFVHEKNVASLSSMVEELKLDPCAGQAQASSAKTAAKDKCQCRICTSPLLQQLSSLGLTTQNYKEVRERLRKMLDQKAQGLKTKAGATLVATVSVSQSGKVTKNVQAQQQSSNATTSKETGTQKNPGKQKAAQQQKTKASSVPNKQSTANVKQQQQQQAPPPPPVVSQTNKPGSSKTPAPIPPYVKQAPPPPTPVPASGKQKVSSGRQPSCTTNGKHPICICGEGKLLRNAQRKAAQSGSSSSSSTQPSTPVRDARDIDALVDFIEGTDRGQVSHKNEKKAAKKARQKLKKMEERQMQMEMQDEYEDYDDDEEEEEMYPPPAAVIHVKQQKQRNSPAQPPPPQRQAASQQAAALANQTRKGSPQMVTIRRVMEHSSAEPTVTITLKGDTPEKDTVLFTLVNGQVCKENEAKQQGKGKEQQKPAAGSSNQQPTEKSKKKKKGETGKNNQANSKPAPVVATSAPVKVKPVAPVPVKSHVTVTPIPQQSTNSGTAGTILEPMSYLPSGPNQHPRPPSSNSLLFTSQSSMGLGAFYAPATFHPPSNPAPPPQQHHSSQSHNHSNFNLDQIKLPPGITITKVEAPHHNQLDSSGNVRMQNKEQQQQQHESRQYMQPQVPPLPPGVTLANSRMGGIAGMSGPMGIGGGMGMSNPNVIVVDTGKLIEDSNHQHESNGMMHHNGQQNSVPSGNYVTLKRVMPNDHEGAAVAISSCDAEMNGDQNTTSKKKKNKKKGKGKKVDEWNLVESVFTPKDIDLDAVDDDERELEAFKRFCFNSVPRERKEKVHLNIKDLVIKKKP